VPQQTKRNRQNASHEQILPEFSLPVVGMGL
jgi:hypothetical protein